MLDGVGSWVVYRRSAQQRHSPSRVAEIHAIVEAPVLPTTHLRRQTAEISHDLRACRGVRVSGAELVLSDELVIPRRKLISPGIALFRELERHC